MKVQLQFQQNLVNNTILLKTAEQIKLDNGESSVFLVNARETSLISNQIKLYELKSKFAKAQALLYWAAGTLTEYSNGIMD